MIDWERLQEAVDTIRTKDGVHRIDGKGTDCKYKVYRVTGGIIRIDLLPQEAKSG